MLDFLLFILIVVSISFVKAYKKTGSFSAAIEYIKKSKTKKDVQNESSTFEKEDDNEEYENINVTTVERELTKIEINHISLNIRFLSSVFITASLINLSVNLDREIYIDMFNITIYTWYFSLFFLLLATLTFFKSSKIKKSGKILLLEGKAEILSAANIVHLGEFKITLPKSWYVKDGSQVSIEGYETYAGNVTALNMGYNSVDGSNTKKRGKWIVLSIFLFINLFISGVVYDGGRLLNKLLAVQSITSESEIIASYDTFITKSFTKGQYIQLQNIDSIVVNNTDRRYRVLLPDSNGINLDLSDIYHRLEKLKELQGTLMFNTLKYYYMDDIDFSFSTSFDPNDFVLFLEDDDFSYAIDQWEGYLNKELWVDITQAETDLDSFIEGQVDKIKSELNTAIEETIYSNNYVKLYPTYEDNSFELEKSQLYIKYFDEPFEPEFNLEGYAYIKDIEDSFKQSEKISDSFFFIEYLDGEKSTHIKIYMLATDRDLLLIYYRAGIFALSLLLYFLVVGISIRIKKLNNKPKEF